MTSGLSVGRGRRLLQSGICGGALFAVSLLSVPTAYAVSDRVKSACRNDYFEHCSQYAVGSDDLRQCMRKVGEDLSTPCLVALVQEGEITKEDVERHNAAKPAAEKKKSSEAARVEPVDPKSVGVEPASKHKVAKKKKHTKKTVEAEAAPDGKPNPSVKAAKVHKAKAHKAGTKATTAKAKKTTASKKKEKKSKAAHTTAATKSSVKPSAKPTHKKKTSLSKKPTKNKAEATTKKKKAGTAAKGKKTTKKKSAAKHVAKPVDAQAP